MVRAAEIFLGPVATPAHADAPVPEDLFPEPGQEGPGLPPELASIVPEEPES